jgi:hypothetical protein
MGRRIVSHRNAEPSEPVDHDPRVFAIQRPFENRYPFRQRRAYQRPIGDALGAGRANRGIDRTGGPDFDLVERF